MKNESLPETTFLLVGGECLDRGSLPACQQRKKDVKSVAKPVISGKF